MFVFVVVDDTEEDLEITRPIRIFHSQHCQLPQNEKVGNRRGTLCPAGGGNSVVKDLRRMAESFGIPIQRCVIVDDTAVTYSLNPQNAIPVPSFEGHDDDIMSKLHQYLQGLLFVEDVTQENMQHWLESDARD